MQRDDHFRMLKIPLLIGGATTSRAHTAVKIAPNYEGPVVHVTDASRSVRVAQSLLADGGREKYVAEIEADYAKLRDLHANKKAAPLIRLGRRAREPRDDRLAVADAAEAEVHRPSRVPQLRPRRDRAGDRLGAVLPDLGAARARFPRS